MADQIQQALSILSRIAFYTSWPFVKLAHLLTFILSPFWRIAQFFLLPFTVLVQGLLGILLLPFRLNLLERFETIYIYLGIASLIGFAAGAALYVTFHVLSTTLRIDTATELEDRKHANARTIEAYRAERKSKRRRSGKDVLSISPTITSGEAVMARRQRGLLSQTIIEEEDSDF
ncbi:hypothetical protein BU24DRAFT_254689 [Aaosphaeria arxii CBS 175.79]|uniref:Uncharacterized protein n=1 Tax=Aaosphaeria arxii CBS 175.79 TaxID=1450172 RepID=A0A6A5XJT8_9PLEO|nr:uncharacterized protein BU24DRAFT_254689 [Aaosphaeria arxii CBS 175.79]KAF2012574.1 hypothetical protein BU24DRAFT_254689 [Aaosphaeria arxii CBS 175.79]